MPAAIFAFLAFLILLFFSFVFHKSRFVLRLSATLQVGLRLLHLLEKPFSARDLFRQRFAVIVRIVAVGTLVQGVARPWRDQ